MEKLGQLRARDEWDLIVVDTPPSRSALDFLDAPARLSRFLDGRMLRLLLAPARAGGRSMFSLVTASFGLFSRAVQKILGAQLLTDLSGFVAALDSMFGGFRERADQTYRILQAPETAFLVVAAPEPDAIREAAYFAGRLAAERMPLAGLVLNRVHQPRRRPRSTAEASAGRRGPAGRAGRPRRDRGRAAGPRGADGRRRRGSRRCAAGSPRASRTCRWPRSRRSPPTSTTSTGCARSAAWPLISLAGDRGTCLLVSLHRGLEHLPPARHLRVPAQQRAAARVRSCRPTPRTRSGCRARPRGTRTEPGSRGRSSSPRSVRRPGRTARPGPRSGTPPDWASRRSSPSVHVPPSSPATDLSPQLGK